MIKFEGHRSFPLPLAEVASMLSDVKFLVGCLPDAEISVATPDRAAWKHRPHLSFLGGALNIEMTVVSREPGKAVTFKVFSKGMGASSTVITSLTFQESADGGTSVQWTGELTETTGLLKMVPQGLMHGAAAKAIDDVWAAVTAKLHGH